jgi:AraC-like DNA-binding protein
MSEPVRAVSPSSARTPGHAGSREALVIVIGRAEEVAARLKPAMRGVANVVRVGTLSEARALLSNAAVHALIVEPADAAGLPTAPLVEETRRRHPRTAVLACVAGRRSLSPASLELIRAGAHDVLVSEDLDLRLVLRQVVASARLGCIADAVWPEVEPWLDPLLAPCFRLALKSSMQPFDVDRIAGALGIHRKTLWERCQKRGLPPPRVLLGWCRVIAAAFALDDEGRSVDSIAVELDFPSPSALRNLIQRYLGLTPSELRAHGGSKHAVTRFVSLFRGAAEVAESRGG